MYTTTDSPASSALAKSIIGDHEEMYEYYQKFLDATGDADAQQRWANQLIWEVARHAVGEEIVVYPLMEKFLGAEGKRLADEDRAEHQKVKEHLYKLSTLSLSPTPGQDSSEFTNLLSATMASLKEHNDSEEQKDLPQLEKAMSEGDLEEAAVSFKRTKKFAPTRPHPSAPNQPPFETVVGLMTAPFDKIMDVFTKFPTEEMKSGS